MIKKLVQKLILWIVKVFGGDWMLRARIVNVIVWARGKDARNDRIECIKVVRNLMGGSITGNLKKAYGWVKENYPSRNRLIGPREVVDRELAVLSKQAWALSAWIGAAKCMHNKLS